MPAVLKKQSRVLLMSRDPAQQIVVVKGSLCGLCHTEAAGRAEDQLSLMNIVFGYHSA